MRRHSDAIYHATEIEEEEGFVVAALTLYTLTVSRASAPDTNTSCCCALEIPEILWWRRRRDVKMTNKKSKRTTQDYQIALFSPALRRVLSNRKLPNLKTASIGKWCVCARARACVCV